ncbi:uncharacterized protein TNCV_2774641 [Trichonephila clavipes]|nr:uncharacterized protein TNCV_2774641 [Trichonephila clavipes]
MAKNGFQKCFDELHRRWQKWAAAQGSYFEGGCVLLTEQAFVYDVCTVRMGSFIYKLKFCAHGAPKQTYMLLQNDVPIDFACHGSNLNMQVSSGTQNNSSPNDQFGNIETMSFKYVLLVVRGSWCTPYEYPARIRLQANPGFV